MKKRWRCMACNYSLRDDDAPDVCPRCGAPKAAFLELQEDGYDDSSGLKPVEHTDVLVIGSGAAAFAAAVTARKNGARVIMLEKENIIGGTTSRSGGGFWIPMNMHQQEAGYEDNREDALRYMARYSYPNYYNPQAEGYGVPGREFELLEAHVDNGHLMVADFEKWGSLRSALYINWTGQADVDYQTQLPENKGIRGRMLFTRGSSGKAVMYGRTLIVQMEKWARENGISIYTQMEASSILKDETGRVYGVTAKKDDKVFTFEASLGVVFGTGGYTHNEEFMLQFQRGPHYGGCSAPTNTGDFIRLGAQIGARIGNTAGAFRAQGVVEQHMKYPGGTSNIFYLIGDSVILLDKYGRRIVDEKRNYTDRAMVHFVWDPVKAEWKNMFTFLVFDQRTADLWGNNPQSPAVKGNEEYLITGSTLEELEQNIRLRLERLAPISGGFALDESFSENIKKTIERFNSFAESGIDEDFGRGESAYDREWTTFPPDKEGAAWPPEGSKNYTMYPISSEGPYYATILGAGTLDTNGGPVINRYAQVLDWNDQPIEGLYGAGNCIASPTANAYWGGGSTIGPALTFGYIAGNHITKNK